MKRTDRIGELEESIVSEKLCPGLTEDEVMHLMQGWSFNHGRNTLTGNYPEERRRQDWEEHKSRIMEYWMREPESHVQGEDPICKPGGPFTRPVAWWQYEAPELRRCVNHSMNDWCCYDKESSCKRKEMANNWGNEEMAKRSCQYNDGTPFYKPHYPAKFEPVKKYLIRLNLLTETEKQLLQ